MRFYRSAERRGRPGFVLYVQTFGDLVTFNPHIHALVADGVFLPDGSFLVLPALPEAALAEALRRAVLALLVRRGLIDEDTIGVIPLGSDSIACRVNSFSPKSPSNIRQLRLQLDK